jgi:NADPH:quinone reductase
MKALIMTAPAADGSTTSVADIDEPRPGPGQVAIDVAYAGVNFIDVMARRGDPGYASGWPYVPGLEVAGTIRSVGSGAHDLRAGERVAAFTPGGGMAEVAIAGADVTVRVPPDVPLETAAAAPLAVSTALLLLTDRARVRPGESVLMHSASGGIGSVVSQVAAALGSRRRLGTVGRADKIAAGLAVGWDDVFARETGPAGLAPLVEAVRKVAPEGVDVILDPVGTALLDLDLSIAAPGGRIVLFGNAAGGDQAPLPPAGRLIGGNIGVLGFSMSRLSATAPNTVASALAKGLEMIAAAQIRLGLTVVEPLESVAAIHDLLAAGRGSGKYVARCSEPRGPQRLLTRY